MKKADFIENLCWIVADCPKSYQGNKQAIRELFSDTLDNFQKNGDVTTAQANRWVLTDYELKKLMKIKRG